MRLDPGTAALLTLPPLFWAGNAVAARLIVGDVPPVALSLARWVIAAALLLPFAWRATVQHRAALLRHWRILLAIGPLGVGAYNTLQYLALQTSTPLATSLIASSSPVFVLALGAIVFGERTRAAQWTGAALSVAGVVLVMARGDPANLAQLSFVPGDLIMLVANLTWTLYTWLLRRHRPDLPFAPLLAVQIAIGKGCADMPQGCLLIGNCTAHQRDKGIFVPGCPPVGSQILAVLAGQNSAPPPRCSSAWDDVQDQP